MSTFRVALKKTVDDSYEIEVGRDLAGKLAEDLKRGLVGGCRRFALITDSNVEKLYAEAIRDRLAEAGFEGEIFAFPAGEKNKTRETKAALEDRMLEAGYRRDCFVLAVGGGVVSDLAGFLAGTYGRGVPFINYATTLLAAADASVGGKTAVDTPLATNLIGLFNQPKKVYIDIDCWSTLHAREISSGLAETVKHACLADEAFFEYLEAHMDGILQNEPKACERMAQWNCEIKYQVVMKDEREAGLRAVCSDGIYDRRREGPGSGPAGAGRAARRHSRIHRPGSAGAETLYGQEGPERPPPLRDPEGDRGDCGVPSRRLRGGNQRGYRPADHYGNGSPGIT